MSIVEYLSIGKPEMCDFKPDWEPYWFSSTPHTTPTSSTRTVPAKSPSYYFRGCDAFSLFSSLFAQERSFSCSKASPLIDSYSSCSFWLFALFVESRVSEGMISAALNGSVCFSRTLRLFCSSLCVDYTTADSSYKLVSESCLLAFGSLKSSCCYYASSFKPSLDSRVASPNLGVPLIKSKKSMKVLSRLNK